VPQASASNSAFLLPTQVASSARSIFARRHFGKHLAFFFLNVMVDVLAKHGDLGVVQLVVRCHRSDLGDEVLRRSVFHRGFVEQVGLDLQLRGRPGRRSLPRSSRARSASRRFLPAECPTLSAVRVGFGELFVLLEELFDLRVVALQERGGVGLGCCCRWQRAFLAAVLAVAMFILLGSW
jgi:hypothetical protein